MGFLLAAEPGVPSLSALHMKYDLTGGIRSICREMVTDTPTPITVAPTYIIQEEVSVAPTQAIAKRHVRTVKRWDLHKTPLYRMCYISQVEELPKIWRIFSRILKDKAKVAIEISRLHKAQDMCYPPPHGD